MLSLTIRELFLFFQKNNKILLKLIQLMILGFIYFFYNAVSY